MASNDTTPRIATPTRRHRIVGKCIVAMTIATGIALGSAGFATADDNNDSDGFNECLKKATPDTEIVCCIAVGGIVHTWPDGSYMGCERHLSNSPSTPTTKPKPAGPVIRPPVVSSG